MHHPQDIFKPFRLQSTKLPGGLASIRRLLESGEAPEDLLSDAPNRLHDIFEYEWIKNKVGNLQARILSVLSINRSTLTVNQVAKLFGIGADEVLGHMKQLTFIDVESGDFIRFKTQAFHEFVAQKLEALKSDSLEILIRDLDVLQPEHAFIELPAYLEQAGRHDDILKRLSPEYFQRVIFYSQSLSPVRQHVELGLRSAGQLEKTNDHIKFSLYRSTLSELSSIDILQSEIEARIGLGDLSTALALANRPLSNEDKFYLLSVAAKEIASLGQEVDETLQQQIRNVHQQTDFESLKDRASEISSLLVYSMPDLAIEVLEQVKNLDTNEGVFDWALTQLSLEALNLDTGQSQDTFERIRQKITDPRFQSFTATFSLLAGEYTASEIVAQAETVSSMRERLFLLTEWAINYRENDDAYLAIEKGLQLMIEEVGDFSPTATHFRKIASPLPYIKDTELVRRFIKKLDAHLGNIEKYGPTEDFIRLRLTLARAEVRVDPNAARDRLTEIYFDVLELQNEVLRASCLARIAAMLDRIDPAKAFEVHINIHESVNNDLDRAIVQLLESTAEHFLAIKGVIQALARVRPVKTIDLCNKLNTQLRRDEAVLEALKTVLRSPTSQIDLTSVCSAIRLIHNTTLRDKALFLSIKRLQSFENFAPESVSSVMSLLAGVDKIVDSDLRCNAYCLLFRLMEKTQGLPVLGTYSEMLIRKLNDSWEAIDSKWRKIDIGFKIAHFLPQSARDLASEYLSKAENLRSITLLSSTTNVVAYVYSIRLALRVLSGLIEQKEENENDLLRLKDQIGQIPSDGEQAILWSDLSLYYFLAGRNKDGQQLVLDVILPLLDRIPKQDEAYYSNILIYVSPALYKAHAQIAFERIGTLDIYDQDLAYDRIASFILHKQVPSDPYSTVKGQAYPLEYRDAIDLCSIVERVNSDRLIYELIESLADSMKRNTCTRYQRTEIAQKLQKIVNDSFPRSDYFIKHDGFKLISLAQILRIEQRGNWDELMRQARNIGNLVDKAYVIGVISDCMSNRKMKERQALLLESSNIIDSLPFAVDKVECYKILADGAIDIDRGLFRKYIKLGMTIATEADTPELHMAQRALVDLAYTIEPEFASNLASAIDENASVISQSSAASRVAALNVKRTISVLELKSQMERIDENNFAIDHSQIEYLPKVAWNHLGSLNAGRVIPTHMDKTKKLIPYISQLPFSKAYPVIALIFETIRKRLAGTRDAQSYLRPLFDSSMSNADLIERLANHSSVQVRKPSSHETVPFSDTSVLVTFGSRNQAVEYLRNWLTTHVQDYIKICDAYFGPEDIELLHLLLAVNPACRVEILTSREHHSTVLQPWEDAYRNEWRKVSDHRPPLTDVVIVGLEKSDGKSPIHDRWWLTERGGLRLGNSFHALGISRDSEISAISPEQAQTLQEKSVDRFLYRREREYMGQRLLYTSFSL